MISAFDSVRMYYTKLFIKHHSSTALLRDIFVSVTSLHMFTRKDALLKLKIYTVLTQNLRKKLTLDLFDKLIYRISEGEVAFAGGVGMQVYIHE